MEMILTYAADILLIVATLGAATYCFILSRRLTRLSRIDNGLGGAIAVLSAQVDDMSKALAETKSGSEGSAQRLETLNIEAKTLLEELELVMSACHDVDQARPTFNADADAAWLEVEDEDQDQPKADEPVVEFGSRRHHVEEEKDQPIPLFLKSKSRLANLA